LFLSATASERQKAPTANAAEAVNPQPDKIAGIIFLSLFFFFFLNYLNYTKNVSFN